MPTVVSLVPSATDLILAMGAGDHLVGVSTFDDRAKDMPRVGDYKHIDWELMGKLRPEWVVTPTSDFKLPYEFRQRTESMLIKRSPAVVERLSDVYAVVQHMGVMMQEEMKAYALEQKLRNDLDSVRRANMEKHKVRVLLVVGKDWQVVGCNNYLDDLISTICNADNVAQILGGSWPVTDSEMVVKRLRPEVVILLLPDIKQAEADKLLEKWYSLPDLPAVRQNRVHLLRDWYVLQPGSQIGMLAEQLAELIHPSAPTSAPATRPKAPSTTRRFDPASLPGPGTAPPEGGNPFTIGAPAPGGVLKPASRPATQIKLPPVRNDDWNNSPVGNH